MISLTVIFSCTQRLMIFTGLLDEILSTASKEHKPQVKTAPASMFGIFQHPKEPPVSIGATKYHSDQLAVVLSHELGHLLLSHSLEAWASSNFYDLLGTLSTDRKLRIADCPHKFFLNSLLDSCSDNTVPSYRIPWSCIQ